MCSSCLPGGWRLLFYHSSFSSFIYKPYLLSDIFSLLTIHLLEKRVKENILAFGFLTWLVEDRNSEDTPNLGRKILCSEFSRIKKLPVENERVEVYKVCYCGRWSRGQNMHADFLHQQYFSHGYSLHFLNPFSIFWASLQFLSCLLLFWSLGA